MSRGGLAPAALLTAALLAAALLAAGCGGAGELQLWRMEPRPFLHQIRAEGLLRAARSQKLNVPGSADQALRLAWLADDGQPVAEGEVVARFDRQPIDKQLTDGRRNLQKAELEGRRLEGEDTVARGNLATARGAAELEREFSQKFQKKEEQVFSRRQITESSIDQELARVRSESAADALGSQQRLARTQAELVEITKRKAAFEIETARKGLEALEVRAPHAGLFLRTRYGRGDRLEPGGQMWPGMPVGELPLAGELQAEVYVLEADAGGLAEGQEAEVRIESQPDRLYAAKITRVDASARPRFRGSPVQYFAVTLSFDEPLAVSGKLGQQVSARLVVDRRDAALVLPRQAVSQAGGKSWAQVSRGGRVERVELKLGPAAAGQVVVESGLAAGDLVVLPRGDAAAGGAAVGQPAGAAAGAPAGGPPQ